MCCCIVRVENELAKYHGCKENRDFHPLCWMLSWLRLTSISSISESFNLLYHLFSTPLPLISPCHLLQLPPHNTLSNLITFNLSNCLYPPRSSGFLHPQPPLFLFKLHIYGFAEIHHSTHSTPQANSEEWSWSEMSQVVALYRCCWWACSCAVQVYVEWDHNQTRRATTNGCRSAVSIVNSIWKK